MATLITTRGAIAAKIESVPYTFETMSNADYNIKVKEVTIEKSQENHEQKYLTRNMSTQDVVKGRETVTITFTVPVMTSGVAGVPPKEGKLLQACGQREITSAFGVMYVDDGSITSFPISIEFVAEFSGSTNHTGIKYQFRGCMGNVEEKVNAVGEPIYRTYEFKGASVGVFDVPAGSMPMPTGMDSTIPFATKGTTLKLASYLMNANTITYNQNNVISVRPSFAATDGNEGAYRTDHNPGGSIDPDIAPSAVQFIHDRMTGTTGTQIVEWSYRAGSVVNMGDNYRIHCLRNSILQSHSPTDREGGLAHTIEFRSLGNGATGGEATVRIYGNPTGVVGYSAYYGAGATGQ